MTVPDYHRGSVPVVFAKCDVYRLFKNPNCASVCCGYISGGTAAGEYAGLPLKAGSAAQPRGCAARFLP